MLNTNGNNKTENKTNFPIDSNDNQKSRIHTRTYSSSDTSDFTDSTEEEKVTNQSSKPKQQPEDNHISTRILALCFIRKFFEKESKSANLTGNSPSVSDLTLNEKSIQTEQSQLDYVIKIIDKIPCQDNCLVVLLIYIDRLPHVDFSKLTYYQALLIVGSLLVLAIRYVDPCYRSDKVYAQILDTHPSNIEAIMLRLLEIKRFDLLGVCSVEYGFYFDTVCSHRDDDCKSCMSIEKLLRK